MIADNGGESGMTTRQRKPRSEEPEAPAQTGQAGAIEPVETEQQKINRLGRAAQGGDAKALAELTEVIGEARLWEAVETLSRYMQRVHIGGLGEDLLRQGAAEAEAKKMRRELLGERSTPLERVLVDCVVTCWLDMHSADYFYTCKTNGMSLKQAEFYDRAHDRAHRRFLSACKTLATVRRLALPALQVNIGQKQVNIAAASPPAADQG